MFTAHCVTLDKLGILIHALIQNFRVGLRIIDFITDTDKSLRLDKNQIRIGHAEIWQN